MEFFLYNRSFLAQNTRLYSYFFLTPTYFKHTLNVMSFQANNKEGFCQVYLPFAIERKYPYANREWGWQYIFPASKRSIDPRAGVERRRTAHGEIIVRLSNDEP